MLAVLLAFLPAVCRCHLGLHDHQDHVHLHGECSALHSPHGGVARADHQSGHEHVDDLHHDHDTDPSSAEHDVLSLLLCEHGEHECDCMPLVTTVQKGNDLLQNALVAFLPSSALSIHSFPTATPARLVVRQREHIPKPPTALLRLRCALII